MGVHFHEEQCRKFIDATIRAYRLPAGLYVGVHHDMPAASVQRRFVPVGIELGGESHIMWLTIVNFFDSMSESYQVHGAAWAKFGRGDLFKGAKVDHLFDKRVRTLSIKELQALFRQIGFSFPGDRAKRFKGFVQDLYGPVIQGDPRRIFTELGGSIDEIYKRITRGKSKMLPGYGQKLLSLLALYFYEFGVHAEMFPGAYPADRHVQRQLIQSGVITIDATKGSVDAAHVIAEIIRTRLIPLLAELGVSVLEFSHAQWFLGNRLCRHCASWVAEKRTGKIDHACPLWKDGALGGGLCEGGRGTSDYHKVGRWKALSQPKSNKNAKYLGQERLFED